MFLYQTKKQKQEKAKIQTSKETVEGRGKEICQFESCERESVIDRKS